LRSGDELVDGTFDRDVGVWVFWFEGRGGIGPFSVVGESFVVEFRLRTTGDISPVNDLFTLGDGSSTRSAIEPGGSATRSEKLARGVANRQAAATESDDPSDRDGRSVGMSTSEL
jgi:hypothetical protein